MNFIRISIESIFPSYFYKSTQPNAISDYLGFIDLIGLFLAIVLKTDLFPLRLEIQIAICAKITQCMLTHF
jgi:hypothetical protein